MAFPKKIALLLFFSLTAWTPAGAKGDAVNLPVPFIWEIPDGQWVPPWNNACEEATIAMLDQFYLGRKEENIGRTESKNLMRPLFGIEDKIFGSNADTDAARTLRLIKDYSNFDGTIKYHPAIEEITAELSAGRPVISLHYGYGLNNPLHRFRAGGSSYHMIVLTGFDADKKMFYANDSELREGLDFSYSYDTIMSSLHDFDHTARKANGDPVVIFTREKQLARETPGHRVYLIENGAKRYVTHPRVFEDRRWSWSVVKPLSPEELRAFPDGPALYRDGETESRLVKTAGRPEIYLIENGRKHYITRPEVFKLRGWSWASVTAATIQELDSLKSGAVIDG